jgi:uncharacterized iron-regulated membrane protein
VVPTTTGKDILIRVQPEASLRTLVRTAHLWIALVAAVFVVMLGVTGSIMAFEPELDHLLHRRLWHVDPQPPALTLADIAASLNRTYSGKPISRFELSTVPDLSYRVAVDGQVLHVNQYTGEVIGPATPQPDTLAKIHQLHLRLLWMSHPDAGKAVVSWMCTGMIVLLATGFYLWWPLKRFTVAWHASPRRRWLDIHAATGIFVFGFLLLLGLTGIVIGFDDVTEPMWYRMTESAPSRMPAHPITPQSAPRITPDRALEIARAAVPGATPFNITVPKPDGTYSVRMRFPEDLTPGGRSRAEIDQYTGEVVFAEGSRTAPAGTRIVNLNRAIHTGDIYGLPTKALMSLASALTMVMATSGLITWWQRRRAERAR